MKRCIICLFICFSKIGCRNCLLRQFAFLPPKPSTYTFRKSNPKPASEATISSRFNNQLQSVQSDNQNPRSEISPTIMSNASSIGVNKLRIHRISSSVTEKEFRCYKTDNLQDDEEVVLNKKYADKDALPSYIREELSIKPKHFSEYPKYDLKLITPQRQIIDVEEPEDLFLSGYFIRTVRESTIPVLFIQPQNKVDYVVIYSHPNSTDLGLMLDNYLDLASNLGVNVIGYDYTGYGQSTGKASDLSAIADIEAVYKFCIFELQFQWDHIILYGQSIGSGPSVTLASNWRYPVAGLIIHAGIASGLRVIDSSLKKTHYEDLFPNIDLLEYVNSLVFIFHGTNDLQIGVEHAEMLSRQVKNLYQVWYVEDGGHNNIEFDNKQF